MEGACFVTCYFQRQRHNVVVDYIAVFIEWRNLEPGGDGCSDGIGYREVEREVFYFERGALFFEKIGQVGERDRGVYIDIRYNRSGHLGNAYLRGCQVEMRLYLDGGIFEVVKSDGLFIGIYFASEANLIGENQ